MADPEFENYNKTSATYDDMRLPIGLDNLKRAMETAASNVGTTVDKLKLLDVGCGTGNYIAAIKDQVASCDGLEYNDGMLKVCREKLGNAANVTLRQGSALNLDEFEDGTYDIVIMTQVMHHLDPDTHQQAYNNMSRVLKKGGAFWF